MPGQCSSDGTEDGVADDLDERIKRRAYEIWEREGRPEGRGGDHWKLASEELAIEDNQRQALLPNPSGGGDDTASRGEPVEPLLSVESQTEGIAPAGQDDAQPAPYKRTRSTRASAGGARESAGAEAGAEAAPARSGGKKGASGSKASGKAGKKS
jgi:Protein of unknown function (DUF2934)